MFSKRTFIEVMALSLLLCCVWTPAVLWTVYSIREGKLAEFPASYTGFMGAASGLTLGILGIQWFAPKAAAAAVSLEKTP